MGMTLNARNLFDFLSYISPFLLAFTFILIGFMNNEPVKPVIYLGSLLLTMGLVVGLIKFNSDKTPSTSAMCNMWNLLDDSFYRPSISTYFITFTFAYVMLSMLMTSNMNYYMMTFILVILVSDTISKFSVHKCMTFNGLMLGFITALILGTVSALGIYYTDPNLLFFNMKQTNNKQCGVVGNKKFVCSVYKNGKLIKNL